MTAYYNEIDPYAAQWLRNLIAKNLIAPGDVDERSIVDVQPDDLKGYTQCHFFAGIGGWSYAARLAGWSDARELWTGSCPCQPFSSQGKRSGFQDERHLWPAWQHLIAQRLPSTVFGEQVANAPEWLWSVRSDLVEMGYAMGAIPIEAASAGGYQLRDRYWFVASYPGAHDRGSIDDKSKGQEPQLRGGLLNSHDRSREGSIARWVIPDASLPTLAHEIPNRLGQYRAIGNSIDPYTAGEVIGAYMEIAA